MGNTANNNWPYPESTDLVKDGATAIENLADAIDTTLGVFTPSTPGLSLISTTSFSGVSSVSVNSVFSATYNSYIIDVFNNVGSAATGFTISKCVLVVQIILGSCSLWFIEVYRNY
jgi:hypothetical protein